MALALLSAIPAVVGAIQQWQQQSARNKLASTRTGLSGQGAASGRGPTPIIGPGSMLGSGPIIPGIPGPAGFRQLMEQAGVPLPPKRKGSPGAPQIPTFSVTGTYRRRYRRMNIANVKALRRAGRRLQGFVKLAKSMVQLHDRAKIKKRRRR